MEIYPDSSSTDPFFQLPRDIYYQLVHRLKETLPPPLTDSAEDLARRDNAFIAQIASMLPANAEEANIASQHVAAQAHAMACLRDARLPNQTTKVMLQCTAQAASMMRQANAACSLLLRVQSARHKREANNQLLDQANMLEHCTMSLMIDTLGRTPPAPIADAETQVHTEPTTITQDQGIAPTRPHSHRAALPDFRAPPADFMQAFGNRAAAGSAAPG
jgi:hypothetical protein